MWPLTFLGGLVTKWAGKDPGMVGCCWVGIICALLLSATPVAAQDADGDMHRWSIGAGVSVITGTPHRPRPRAGDGLTGAAGPEQGMHLRASLERHLAPWLLAGGELSYNRLTTSTMTFNCLPDIGSDATGTCYPAAGVDEATAVLATMRAEWPGSWGPFATIGAGAAAFRLTVDEPFEENPNLEDQLSVRPAVRAGIGVTGHFMRVRLSLEASFNASLGRGGGTHHIPVTSSVGF